MKLYTATAENTPSLFFEKAELQAREHRIAHPRTPNGALNTTGMYMTLTGVRADCASKVRDLSRTPAFFPCYEEATSFSELIGTAVYFGGPSAGTGLAHMVKAPPHADLGSCEASWQAQLTGVKRWHFVDPLDGDREVELTTRAGDVLFFYPQWYHEV